MQTFDLTWQNPVCNEIFARCWSPDGEAKAVVCLVHGLGEHCGRYQHVAQFLTGHSYALLALDLCGHGRSGGKRGHVDSIETFRLSIDRLLQEASQRFPGRPRFLYGHSMGGILVLNYALQRKPELAGVIATSSGLRTALEDQKLKVALAKTLGNLLPSGGLPSGLDSSLLSRDPQVERDYKADPLVHDRVSFGLGNTLLKAIAWNFKHAAEFSLPLLLVHGSADGLAFPRGSQEFAGLVHCDCTLKIWPGLYHETHNEPEKQQVLTFTLEWMESKL